ncbi:MAG: tRNA dihydrouridine synthase DusB [Eubacteriales bacterium]|nr:tRNA dihydrouridine synthase DusB [Eubacteriales bacterium]
MENKEQKLSIGGVELKTPFLLGPMAGFTDAPMRRLCEEMGAGLTYTEMVSARALHYNDEKSKSLLYTYPSERPVAIQIFGHEPELIAEAAEKLEPLPTDILDINMGCPVPKVFKNGDGSALMQDPELVEKVVNAAATHTSKPVTVKIRLGVDRDHMNAVEVAQAAEAGGAAAIAVHGRTRVQYYEGRADWDRIAEVRKAVSVPVIANGDVTDVESAKSIMEATGCRLIMVARGALGNPWIFRDLSNWWFGRDAEPAPGLEEKKAMMKRQLLDMVELKGEYTALREMRKVSGFYLKGLPGGAKVRGVINRIDDMGELLEMIDLLGTPELLDKVAEDQKKFYGNK